MLVKLFGSAVYGVDAKTITVEVDTPGGVIGVFIVGLPDNAVKESTDRVISAIQNSGFDRPRARIVINMAPADIKKAGDPGGVMPGTPSASAVRILRSAW